MRPDGVSESGPVSSAGRSTPATWLAWPTLSEASFGPEATGTLHHVGELEWVINRWGDLFTAELVGERTGPYADAVRLVVDGKEVGSVPHGVSDKYRPVVEALNAQGLAATCRISADRGELAPWLLILGRPAIRQNDAPFLPPSGPGDFVVLSSGEMERLDSALASRAKTKHVGRTVSLALESGGLGVWLDGLRVGSLAGEYPRVQDAERERFPLTCHAMLRRDPGRGFRLQAFVPR